MTEEVSAIGKTRWLSDEEQAAWRSFLEATRRLFDAVERQLSVEAGIPHTYYEILVRLSEAPERSLRMSQLADASVSSRSRLSHAVTRLEQRGWVSRCPASDDGRGQLARLTDSGFAALVRAAPGHVAEVRAQLIDRLTPDQVASLREISDAIRQPLSRTGDGEARS